MGQLKLSTPRSNVVQAQTAAIVELRQARNPATVRANITAAAGASSPHMSQNPTVTTMLPSTALS
jgi:hypothetical protein